MSEQPQQQSPRLAIRSRMADRRQRRREARGDRRWTWWDWTYEILGLLSDVFFFWR